MATPTPTRPPSKPVLLTIDDDAAVARAVQRDLRKRYAKDYRVLSAESGAAGLEIVEELKRRDDQVALFLVDQRMPRMNGVEFLEKAVDRYPKARRALLTAYADRDAAITAINEIQLHYYLQKPWDPPEQNLYPIIDQLLYDWQTVGVPREPRVRIVAEPQDPAARALRDFLARNGFPWKRFDAGTPEGDAVLASTECGPDPELPVAVFTDGTSLEAPTVLEVARKLELPTEALHKHYDLAIVGAGPAGLAAAVYGASEGLSTVLVEREAPGGQAGTSSRIENYLGFPGGITGALLAQRAHDQAKQFRAEILAVQTVTGLELGEAAKTVHLSDGTQITAEAVIVSTGVAWRRLEAEGIEALTGRGVFYGAALLEIDSCRDASVYIVGGANSAGQAAMAFAEVARSVTILVRANLEKSMSDYLVKRIHAAPNIEVRTGTTVQAVRGTDRLEGVTVRGPDGDEELPGGTMFIFIGASPETAWLDGAIARDDRGFVLTGRDLRADGRLPEGWSAEREPYLLETSVAGVFAAGDVRHESIKRVASAVGEGAMAVQFVHHHLAER